MVGRAIAEKLVSLGHGVAVGARSRESESLAALGIDGLATTGSFAEAAAFGELLINATNGLVSLDAIGSCDESDLDGKTLIDVANMLEPQPTGPPKPIASVDNCLAVKIQDAHPGLRVVKSLNTMNCSVMVDPAIVSGEHVVFVSGDDADAKAQTVELLKQFGWSASQIVDLGGIDTAAGAEMIMPLWLSVMSARGGFNSGPFNFAIHQSP